MAASDYGNKGMAGKHFYEVERLVSNDDDNRKLLGVYSMHRLMSMERGRSLRSKADSHNLNEVMKEVLENHPEFRVVVLKYLSAYLAGDASTISMNNIDRLFTKKLLKMLQSDSFDEVVHALNIIGRLCQTWTSKEALHTIEAVMRARDYFEGKFE